VVFGNGVHPTTRDCLEALNLTARIKPLRQVLDVGTGTGILSLAAALLGAKEVLAVDLNPLCVKTARRNVHLNGMDRQIRVTQGGFEAFMGAPADLVIANIHHAVIRDILARRDFLSRDRIIFSGLMRSQAGDIRMRLEKLGFRLIQEWDHEMTWFTFLAEKRY
jgi:ribosomal protein L11 methyltransferase